jgi:hypothetical protein
MVAAQGQGEPFRGYQLKLACTFVHEVAGHMLLTFLDRDRPVTPPTIGHAQYTGAQAGGESGRFLEQRLWGGAIEFYREPSRGDLQVSRANIC